MTLDYTSVRCCSSCSTRFLIFSIFAFLHSKTSPGFCSLKEMRTICMICSVCNMVSSWSSAATPGVSSQLHKFLVAIRVDFRVASQLAPRATGPSRGAPGSGTGWGRGHCRCGPGGSFLPSASFGPVTPPVSVTFRFCGKKAVTINCCYVFSDRAQMQEERASCSGSVCLPGGAFLHSLWSCVFCF